jgi:hypothetical protein
VEKKINLLHKLESNKVKLGDEGNEEEDYWELATQLKLLL